MLNYFRTNVLGYTITDAKGKLIFKGLKDTYNDVLEQALLNVGQGKETFDSAMSKILKELGTSGLKTLDYESGRSVRLDSAVRMHLKSRLRELHNENQKIIGEEFGANGVEISVHENPAVDHEKVQGRQFSNEEYEKLNSGHIAKDYKGNYYTLDHDNKNGYRPISELNCYHYIFSIVLGASKPEYTDKQLKDIIKKNEKGFTLYDKRTGKPIHYTNYEGTQLQRSIERKIREQKDIQILAKESGNEELMLESQKNITTLTKQYRELSERSGLPTKMDRLRVSGYRRTKAPIKKEISYKILNDDDFNIMEKQTLKLKENLSNSEIKSLGNYTLEEYYDINNYLADPQLRKEDLLTYNDIEKVKKDISNIDSVMTKNEINDNITVFKGTSSKFYEEIIKGNDEFELPIYLSTTGKESVADKFKRNYGFSSKYKGYDPAILEIRVPKGTNGIYMSDIFNENGLNEYEILLDRNLKYKMIKNELVNPSGYENGIYVERAKYMKIIIEVVK